MPEKTFMLTGIIDPRDNQSVIEAHRRAWFDPTKEKTPRGFSPPGAWGSLTAYLFRSDTSQVIS
jgi:hypothetical protein